MGSSCYAAYYYQDLKEWYIYGSESDGRISVLKPYVNEFTDHLRKNAIHLFDQAEPYAMKDTIIEYQANTIGSFTSNARITGHKEYEIKDHLGNVRVVISDVKNPHNLSSSISSWTFTAEIRNLNNYYPYGMELPGGAYASIGNYGYGYNGMEKDDELKSNGKLYSTLFREGDTENGRWWKRDPMEMALVGYSSYIMMGGNPISMIDPDGNIPDFSPMREAEDDQKLDEDDKPSNQILEQTRTITGLNLSYNNEGKMVYDKKDPYLKDDDKNILGSITAREALKAEIDNPKVTEVHLSKGGSMWDENKGLILIDPNDFYMQGYGADFIGISRNTLGPGMIFFHEMGHVWFGKHNYSFWNPDKNSGDHSVLFYHITDDPVINFTNEIRKEMNKSTNENWGQRISIWGRDYYGGKNSIVLPYGINSYHWLMRDIEYNSKKPTPHIQIKYEKRFESKGVK